MPSDTPAIVDRIGRHLKLDHRSAPALRRPLGPTGKLELAELARLLDVPEDLQAEQRRDGKASALAVVAFGLKVISWPVGFDKSLPKNSKNALRLSNWPALAELVREAPD